MEFYSEPIKATYIINRAKWFEMPLVKGGYATVIAVSAKEANYWVIAYTILINATFIAVGHLVTAAVLTFFHLGDKGNRHVMLVSYYNSTSPNLILASMYNYLCHGLFRSRRKGVWAINWDTVRAALMLGGIAAAIMAGTLLSSFFVGGTGNLIVRSAARANPDAIFFPLVSEVTADTPDDIFEQIMPVRAAAAYQALGRVGAAQDKMRKAVRLSSTIGKDDEGRPTLDFSYGYRIKGSDMGLQLAAHLVYDVSGHCKSVYEWLDVRRTDKDRYALWGNRTAAWVANSALDLEALNPTYANIKAGPGEPDRSVETGGFEFAMVPNTQYRRSWSQNNIDPWYLTEVNPDRNASAVPPDPEYRVMRGRPALRCWQNDTWTLDGKTVSGVVRLKDLPGLRLSSFLRDVVFLFEFVTPPVIQLGNNLGYAMLASSQTTIANTKMINAKLCNITNDLERLVETSFVYSREVVRNTVLVYGTLLEGNTLPNGAVGPDGKVPTESADFIIESTDVAALKVSTLVAVPCVMAFLWLLVWFRAIHAGGSVKNTGAYSRHKMRAIALQATQLYRYLDEYVSGSDMIWSERMGTSPYIKEIDGLKTGQEGDVEANAHLVPQGAQHSDLKHSAYVKPHLRVPIHRRAPVHEPTATEAASSSAATSPPPTSDNRADDESKSGMTARESPSGGAGGAAPGKKAGKGAWGWLFGKKQGGLDGHQHHQSYELAMTKDWNPKFEVS